MKGPDRKEREETENLRAQVSKLQEELKTTKVKHQLAIDRYLMLMIISILFQSKSTLIFT